MLRKVLFISFTVFVCELLTVHNLKKKKKEEEEKAQYKLVLEPYWLKKKKIKRNNFKKSKGNLAFLSNI